MVFHSMFHFGLIFVTLPESLKSSEILVFLHIRTKILLPSSNNARAIQSIQINQMLLL